MCWPGCGLAAKLPLPGGGYDEDGESGSGRHCARSSGAGRAPVGGRLAELARPRGHGRQPRAAAPGPLERDREPRLDAPVAERRRLHQHRERRPGVPERGRRRPGLPLVRRPSRRERGLEAAGRLLRGPRPPEAQHGHALAGGGGRSRLRDDRQRGPQGLHRRGQGAVGPGPPEGLRPVRAAVGLRRLSPASRRDPLRAGAPRHEDRRAVLPPGRGPGHRREPLPGGASNRGSPRVAGRVHDAGGGPARGPGPGGGGPRSW
jgi:hypothetical protein